ncbi:uncharacterized protein LOC130290464 isoform X2 [Hyla sarda]|uniref:uncharacterized protein LOC130290464 isoform X2 n=1 Tax=Hyla sarda TaxID=327740 RepID=UPI0024C336FF|nr:uncharacterized protein LOC130290464 isoform X2 [Hyla sarda]
MTQTTMSTTQKESSIHKVKIQQTYWGKDTMEEKMMEMGAVRTGKVVEEVEYYDTDLYDLAVNGSWLSKTGKQWQLIIDKVKATTLEVHSPLKKTKQVNIVDPQISPDLPGSKATRTQDIQKKTNLNGNTDPETSRNLITCYELVQEKEIIACLSQILHIDAELDNINIGNFLGMTGIQKYTSVSNVTRETFQLRDIYTVVIKADGVSTKKSVVISLDVDIDVVTQGFQWIERLANELDLQVQNV